MFPSSYASSSASSSAADAVNLPPVKPSFIPNDQIDSVLRDFFNRFFMAFDSRSCDLIKDFYNPETVSTYTEPQKAVNVDPRIEFIGLEGIAKCWTHKLPTQHDINRFHWDVQWINEDCTVPWISVSCSGLVSVQTDAQKLEDILFSRSFILGKFNQKLLITNEQLMYLGPASKKTFGLESQHLKPSSSKTKLKKSETSEKKGQKRKLKRKADEISSLLLDASNRNPVMVLNELCQKKELKLRFEEESSGGLNHKPWFTCTAVIGEKVFPSGDGNSKKLAKNEAAKLAISYFKKEDGEDIIPQSPDSNTSTESACADNIDFTADEGSTAASAGAAKASTAATNWRAPPKMCKGEPPAKKMELDPSCSEEVDMMNSSARNIVKQILQDEDKYELDKGTLQVLEESLKHPVSLVGEYASKNRLNPPSYDIQANNKGMTCQASMDTDKFPLAQAKNKRDAKNKAALFMLDDLIRKGKFYLNTRNMLPVTPAKRPNLRECDIKNVFDRIASSVQKQFDKLCKQDRLVAETAKVLAGVCIMDRNNPTNSQVVSIATGNRCILGDVMDGEGNVLNDSHAEVVARRGFLRVLYNELYCKYNGNQQASLNLLEQGPNRRLQLRSDLSVHLYVNTAPCGDARIFSLAEAKMENKVNQEINAHHPLFTDNRKHGLIRTKIEKGEGTIPVLECPSVQTWDGIAGGERLRTLSCSDKVLKWNVLGLQGTLLSHFVNPIYLDTISIGALFHHGHTCRALCCRLDGIEAEITVPAYELRHPVIGQAFSAYNRSFRDTAKSVPAAINWNIVDQDVEKVDGQRGLSMLRYNASRLSKRSFFEHFKKLTPAEMTSGKRYREVKDLCTEYVTVQQVFFNHLKSKFYGHWLSKPREEKLFQ